MFELDFLLIELGLLAGDGDVSMLDSKIQSRSGGVSISDSRLKALNEVAMGIIILFLPGIEPQIADSVDSLMNIRNGRGSARNGECAELRRDLETPNIISADASDKAIQNSLEAQKCRIRVSKAKQGSETEEGQNSPEMARKFASVETE